MSFSLIGMLIAISAILGVVRSRAAAFQILCIATLFGAASAIVMGPANITPGHFALGFFLLAVIIRREGLISLFRQMEPSGAGYFLLLATIWAVFTAFAMPRIFNGQIYVIPVSTEQLTYVAEPLRPASTNITQSVYVIGNLVAFCAAAAFVQSQNNMRAAALSVVVAGILNIGLALLDSFTYSIGMSQIMDFMRNANYAQAYTHTVMGMKRITGAFPEASSFVAYSSCLFAFALRLWRGGVYTQVSGYVAAGLFLTIILAFSSTGYVAIGAYLICVYTLNIGGVGVSSKSLTQTQNQQQVFVALGPIALFAVGVIVAVNPDLLEPVTAMFDASITNKLSSDSGTERMAWNLGGIRNFIESFGLGVGLGSVRVSSYPIALLANIGVIGTVLMGFFFLRLFTGDGASPKAVQTEYEHIKAAARSACFAGLLASSVSSTTMDFGLMVAICAGIACAKPLRGPEFVAGVMRGQQALNSRNQPALSQGRDAAL